MLKQRTISKDKKASELIMTFERIRGEHRNSATKYDDNRKNTARLG